MPDLTVIVNTSPLLYLYQVGRLVLLQQLYNSIIIPPAVKAELSAGERQGIDVPDVSVIDWIYARPVAAAALVPAVIDLGRGEAEVIALGLEITDSLLILDDHLARRIADLHSLRYTGTLGVLIKAKQKNLISSVAQAVAELRAKGMWLSDSIIDDALRLSGEL